MSARRYGPQNGQAPIAMSNYHQSKDELAGLPVTVAEKIPVTNTPNIFSYKSYVFAKNPALVQRFIKATKADVGGVGGHVVAADEVKSIIGKYVLDNNSYRGEPIFTSLIVTHTGDDCAVTGIMAETVDMSVVDELMWDALQEGATKAAELGLYGPGQDLVADAFTGNLRGAGPATVALPFPVRKDNASQTVLVSFDNKMEELAKGLQEKVITLRAPEDLYDIEGLTRSSRFVIARVWSRNEKGEKDQLGYICSAERLHNIKTKKGFTYGGKDDPVLLAFAQGDWPAPGEITSPWATAPMVAGDCRGSHNLHILPMPINSQTSYWSGPILSAVTLSCNIHSGRIGAISDQFALGTPWDEVRRTAGQLAIQFRHAHGVKQPATLHEDELEYQEGWKERRNRLERQFEIKPPLTFVNGNGHGADAGKKPVSARPGGRPDEID